MFLVVSWSDAHFKFWAPTFCVPDRRAILLARPKNRARWRKFVQSCLRKIIHQKQTFFSTVFKIILCKNRIQKEKQKCLRNVLLLLLKMKNLQHKWSVFLVFIIKVQNHLRKDMWAEVASNLEFVEDRKYFAYPRNSIGLLKCLRWSFLRKC